ncbi:nucleotide-diphospho-sugar transferase [Daldinia caldariorum]|uniref:nucleotide-diphospho-sugar transferase n=1 Tax=Daldinia caldariorum TaxID=326644 RepID=UPI0020078A43|nr:nucleotide-diphospho-sugar transferase [Daldinia caldariorum]KAI1471027.1 nucleotide-diphospho-sugar transferase [Daldinia caldariorum]
MPATGLQALILCGPGSSFPTFTSNPDENPKALLPIANRPMVWYPIDFCYRTGITSITLVCPPSAADAITTALNTNPFLTALPHPRPDLVAPNGLDQNTGTAEILRLPEIRELITSDFVVLPCDLVCELGGDKLLQAWMVKAASLPDLLSDGEPPNCNGGLGVWYETKTINPIKGEETDFIVTAPLATPTVPTPKDSLLPHLSYLTYAMPKDSLNDLVDEKKNFPIRHGLLRSHPKLRMLTTHRDAHIYILPKWILNFIEENERLETLGEDVIGWWAKTNWETGLFRKLGMKKVIGGYTEESGIDRSPRGNESAADASLIESPWRARESYETSPPADFRGRQHDGLLAKPKEAAVPPILAYIHPARADAPLLRRVDTAQLLLAISLQLAKLPSVEETGPEVASAFAHARKVAYPEGVKPRTTITRQDCLIADNVMVEEKTSIKESVIGANCQIKEGAKLFQCLLMDGVVVGKGCKLTRCILGKRSEVGEGSTLTDCEVQENLLVEPRTEDKDSKLMSSSGLEASEQEMQEALDGIEESDQDSTVLG